MSWHAKVLLIKTMCHEELFRRTIKKVGRKKSYYCAKKRRTKIYTHDQGVKFVHTIKAREYKVSIPYTFVRTSSLLDSSKKNNKTTWGMTIICNSTEHVRKSWCLTNFRIAFDLLLEEQSNKRTRKLQST